MNNLTIDLKHFSKRQIGRNTYEVVTGDRVVCRILSSDMCWRIERPAGSWVPLFVCSREASNEWLVCDYYPDDFCDEDLCNDPGKKAFFLKHGYLLGSDTWNSRVFFVVLFGSLVASKTSFDIITVIDSLSHKPWIEVKSADELEARLRERLGEIARLAAQEKKEIYLLYSGGCDSRVLFNYFVLGGVDFKVSIIGSGFASKSGKSKLRQAALNCLQQGIDFTVSHPLGVDDFEVEQSSIDPTWCHNGLFLEAFKNIPRNSIVVSAQGADSLFALGPGSVSLYCLVARLTWYLPPMLGCLCARVLEKFSGAHIKAGYSGSAVSSKLNNSSYVCNATLETESVIVGRYAERHGETFDIPEPLTLNQAVKIYGFMRGGDNGIWHVCERLFGVKVFLPFIELGVVPKLGLWGLLQEVLVGKIFVRRLLLRTNGLIKTMPERPGIAFAEMKRRAFERKGLS